jgi:hypothetical protein
MERVDVRTREEEVVLRVVQRRSEDCAGGRCCRGVDGAGKTGTNYHYGE